MISNLHAPVSLRSGLPWVTVGAALLCGGLYAWAWLDRGWVPHDEGMLGQSAERVMHGELPHRDFDEPYTGGLSYLHALAFRLFGVHLRAPRRMLYLVFLFWMPAVAYVASRFTTPLGTAGVTALCVAWSIPNYSAAIPSWYNLFLATFGLAALVRGFETRRTHWSFVAGLFGGLSILIKIAGLYFVAAGLLAILYADQAWRGRYHAGGGSAAANGRPRVTLPALVVWSALLAFSAVLLLLLRQRATLADFTHLALPGLALAAVLLWRERVPGARPQGHSYRSLGRWVAWFLAGAATPPLLFTLPYLLSASLPSLLHGVFVAPRSRVAFAAMPFPPLWLAWPAAFAVTALFCARRPSVRRSAAMVTIGAAAALLVFDLGTRTSVYLFVFHAIRVLIPCTVVAAAILLKESPDDPTAGTQATAAFACASTAAVCSLVQFPFSASIYFFYVAPLGALALLGALSLRPRAKILHAALLVAVVAFTVRYVTPGSVYSMGLVYAPNGSRHRLQLPRGRLLVTQEEKGEYEQLVELVTKHARGSVILAIPDSPEVYFLSAKKNPTRALFDFLAPQRQKEVVATLDRAHPSLIVLNRGPGFSPPPTSSLERLLEHRYPHVEHVGRFTVRWR